MSRWVEVDDEATYIDFADKEVSFFVTNDTFGSVYLLLSFDQIKALAKKIEE